MTRLVKENVIINGHRIACGTHGTGTPVVLIHGTPSYSYIWRNVLPQLIASAHKVYLFDLLGYGYSERPVDPDIDTSVSAQVEILAALFDHWNLNQAHIASHDIGGGVGMRFSILHPDAVNSLSLIDTVSFNSWPSPGTKKQMELGLDELIRSTDKNHRAQFSNWIEDAVFNKQNLRTEGLTQYIKMISGPVGQASFFQHQVRHYDSHHTEEITPRLAELGNKPVQLIWGENDTWQITDWAHKLHQAIPGSSLNILPECGHFAMEDQPVKIAELITSFIKASQKQLGPDPN